MSKTEEKSPVAIETKMRMYCIYRLQTQMGEYKVEFLLYKMSITIQSTMLSHRGVSLHIGKQQQKEWGKVAANI